VRATKLEGWRMGAVVLSHTGRSTGRSADGNVSLGSQSIQLFYGVLGVSFAGQIIGGLQAGRVRCDPVEALLD